MSYKTRKTVRRTVLGNMLRRARMAAEVKIETVVQVTGISQPVVYRQEGGVAPVPVDKIPVLADLYKVSDPDEIARWEKWARLANDRGAWGPYGNSLGPSFEDYADVESLALEIWAFEPLAIHGLLQTARYSEEAISTSLAARLTPSPERLKFREARKAILTRSDPAPPRLWVILGEAAVLTPPSVTDETAHIEQIQHLLHMSETAATIQVLPMDTGLHAGLAGAFSMLTLDDGVDIGFRDGYGDGIFSDDPDRIRSYRTTYEQLIGQALSPIDTRRYLHGLLNKMGSH